MPAAVQTAAVPRPRSPRTCGAVIGHELSAIADHRRARVAAARARARLEEAVDASCVARTIPRGAGPRDLDPLPGVDADTWLLHVRLRRTGDRCALAALADEYDRYARSIAVRMHRDNEPMDDLVQVAREGLLSALTRFDPERSIPFPAFATPTILGGLRRHYRDHGWAVRVPRRVHELAVAARREEEHLVAALGRPPSVEELASAVGVSVDELLDAQDALHARNAASIDATSDGADDGGASLGDSLAGPAEGSRFARIDDRLALREALGQLGERDRTVVRLYFFEERSQREIAQELGVSQMQVSRWLSNILRRMRVWVHD